MKKQTKAVFIMGVAFALLIFFINARADFGVTNASFSFNQGILESEPLVEYVGDASFVEDQFIVGGTYHQRSNNFNNLFVVGSVPLVEFVGDASFVEDQFIVGGTYHQRSNNFNNRFLIEFSSKITDVKKDIFVKSELNNPLQGVQIDVYDSENILESQHITDKDGYANVEFKNSESEHSLQIFKILYQTVEVISAPNDNNTTEIEMNRISSNIWLNENWDFVIPVNITPLNTGKCVISESINFDQNIADLGSAEKIYADRCSMKVIEVDSSGNLIEEVNSRVN